MKVTRYPNVISKSKKTLVMGTFAGIHNGHKTLLDVAKSFKHKLLVMIIENPQDLPMSHKKEYVSLDIRLQQLSNLGIEEVVVLKFDDVIENTDGKTFIEKMIKDHNVVKIAIGSDFAFGKNRSMNAKMLEKDYDATVVKIQQSNNVKISTKLLIESVELGHVSFIKKISPFSFTLNERVDANNHFPKSKILNPHPGIYAVFSIVNTLRYWSVVRIGFDGDNEVIIKQLQVKNAGFDATFEFRKQIRSIIKKDQDKITEKDIEDCATYLKNAL